MAPKDSEGGVFVTTKDIYDEVKGMRGDFKEAVTLLKDTIKDVNDHEKRIRVLEKWRYTLPVSLVLAVSGLLGQFHIIGK